MGDVKGFMKYGRALPATEAPENRIAHFKEFYVPTDDNHQKTQAARCMDCGVPFCHNGCPLGNVIPDFNDAVYKEEWQKAYEILIATNNFPEFTGRICPAPCEAACVLGINEPAVAIEYIEKSIIEKAFAENWVKPYPSSTPTGKSIGIVGSGPAGLAAADQLSKVGHLVTVYERADRIGGLLRYGIPDFKLDKGVIDRRIQLMEANGVIFVSNTNVGVDITVEELKVKFDAVILCGGSTVARDMTIAGREAEGVHLAMEYLTENNKKVAGEDVKDAIDVKDQNVIVIGGGDTGSDCIGTSNRLGAKSVTQIEIMPKPGDSRPEGNPWPNWPMTLRTSSSHDEGCTRDWAVLTKRFIKGADGKLSGLEVVKVEWNKNEDGRFGMTEIAGSTTVIPCTKAFLAIGFLHAEKTGLLKDLGVDLDERGNVIAHNHVTSVEGVFTAGDMRRGQSLVVWAIAEGREAAKVVDAYLTGETSSLDTKEESVLAM